MAQRQVGLDPCCHRSEKQRFRLQLSTGKLHSYVTAKVEFTLSKPYEGDFPITQFFGENPDFYSQFTYDGVPLRGKEGVDIGLPTGINVLATDDGVVQSVDFVPGGAGNYLKIQHQWGESVYTQLDEVTVSVGQTIKKGDIIAISGNTGAATGPHLGFRIRIYPYDRADGWGGFSDPAPFSPWMIISR